MPGKRARRAMRRTASMAQLGADPGSPAEQHAPPRGRQRGMMRSSGDLVLMDTAQFLKTCGLCNRRLGPGRDTFMYRGDIAFCSLECRQQQMSQDERKEKCSLTSMKKDSAGPPGTGSEASAGSGTVATA